MRVRAVALTTLCALTLLACAGDPDPVSRVVVEQDVPADVRAELDTTWRRFADRFAARLECVPDVSLWLVRDVEGGDARYVGDAARIEIEIPTTPARFRESLAHELAHHVERGCPAFGELRGELLSLLGETDGAWSEGEVWEEIPSEVWAEAVVQIVNGERLLHAERMPIDDGVIDRVVAWAEGRDLDQPSG